MKEPSLIYSGSVFLSSQLHQSQTSCTELLVGHCSLGLALFTVRPSPHIDLDSVYSNNINSQRH